MKNLYDEMLLTLVKEKDYFVITTNVDHQFQTAGFDKKRLFYTQGDPDEAANSKGSIQRCLWIRGLRHAFSAGAASRCALSRSEYQRYWLIFHQNWAKALTQIYSCEIQV